MNTVQITETLEKLFADNRIIFWNDSDGEFTESLAELVPAGTEILRPDETGALAAKIKIELEKPEQKFLVYAPASQPEPEKDWLYDIRRYSRTFSADSASILLDELGLESQKLRAVIFDRKQFFNSRDRLQKLKKWVQSDDNEKELCRKMIAVAALADQPEISDILLKLFAELTKEFPAHPSPLDAEQWKTNTPAVWKNIEKFGLAGFFWQLMEENFGFRDGEKHLYPFLVRLFVTDLAAKAKPETPLPVKQLVLSTSAGKYNASVFLANWRTNVTNIETYKKASSQVAAEIQLNDWIADIVAANLTDVETFELVERRLIADLRDRLLAPLPADTSDLQNLINLRRDKFWSRDNKSYASIYEALSAALEFYRLRDQYREGFSFTDATAILSAYTKEIYKFDQYYRLFCEESREVKFEGFNILKPLSDGIEKTYGNWYLENLGTAWGKSVEHENLFVNWQIAGFTNQFKFFRQFVKPFADESSERKVYVIISDAFRYECAEELTRNLNSESRRSGAGSVSAEISAMLGVVPSYTALGMASLLPRETLDYKPTNASADVLYADGASTAGHANRIAVLNKFKGTAVKSEELMSLGKDAGRDFVKDWQIIYIYHNVIDAVGDSQSTESDTFKAVRQTIEQIGQIINFVFNTLNGSQILVTADHGFLFQENAPEDLDKSSLDIKSTDVLKRKKRYVINPSIEPQVNAWHGKIRQTSGIVGDMEFLIPKGANRFHFSGGARFVHGGAMPQEICVPLITVKKLRGKTADRAAVSKVNVTLLGNLVKIVNNVQRFDFIQTEAASEKNLPRTLQISLRDDEGKLISNEETVTFDSRSGSMDDRLKRVTLTLSAGTYDRKKQYYLVLNDNESVSKSYLKLPITIDIAFSSDF
jgi:uncharacterized protein (TIGR02687 family)